MYARYTEFEFDAADRERVLAVWSEIGIPSASRQPGWRGATILESEDTPGLLRLVTLWESRDDFERYYALPEHGPLTAAIKGSGMRGRARDGLNALHAATAPGSLVRVTRGRVDPAQTEAVAAWWRAEGKPMTLEAPGCLRAEGYWSEPGRFELVVHWTDRDAAKAFLEGPAHARFKASMDGMGCAVVERIVADRID
jgi:quinol monooxygenase YgiN